jgi:hypothetical protein
MCPALAGATMALLITAAVTATPKAIHSGATRPSPMATIAHPTQTEKVACAQVTAVSRPQACGSEGYFVTDGWITAMGRSGDATLARVGNAWSNLCPRVSHGTGLGNGTTAIPLRRSKGSVQRSVGELASILVDRCLEVRVHS